MAIPPAYMGYVGFVRINTFGIRCTSCELKLTQTIDKPDVISGKYDKTVYKLGPKEVGGTIGFPAVMEAVGGAAASTDLIPVLWDLAFTRSNNGYLTKFYTEVKYTSDYATFLFNECVINTFKWSVTQGDLINVEIDVIGRNREAASATEPFYTNRNARAMTWNDARVDIYDKNSQLMIDGSWIRSFEANVNNNVDRFYTLNGTLAPQDIAPKLRDITGSIVIMGRHPTLAELAVTNQTRCYEDSKIHFGYFVAGTCNANFGIKLPGTVFEIETMSLRNDLMESTMNWHSLPGSKFTATGGPDAVNFVEDFV
jgi:hypothetical protein